jgi:D-aminopeptidase
MLHIVAYDATGMAVRAHDLGIRIGTLPPGPLNAITDVTGVRVGHATLIAGSGPLVVGQGPVRTGVTIIQPRVGPAWQNPCFAGCHRLNGAGELTGLEWVRESGLLTTPIGLTNTHSVGVVRDAIVKDVVRERPTGNGFWVVPVVGETYDGLLNDTNGFHVRDEHVFEALANARGGAVDEGNVGGGTGMVCHGFKGGIGTASRRVDAGYVVGVLVQANYGRRERLRIDGVAVGERIPATEVPLAQPPLSDGSIIVIIASSAPLLPHQCDRLAQRAALGIARVGGLAEHGSGDLILSFATGNDGLPTEPGDDVDPVQVRMLPNGQMNALFQATVEATEEAIVNALVAAETMTGRDGITAHRLPHDRLRACLGADV